MTPITITGALTMPSTNGDGAQLLTEASEFFNALAQMGVQMAVEISLRPVAPVYSVDAQDLPYGTPVAPAPANPTPAAPAQPDAPPLDLPLWSTMTRAQRAAAVVAFGGWLAQQSEYVPMLAWNTQKPSDWPPADGIAKVYSPDRKWATLAANWSQS